MFLRSKAKEGAVQAHQGLCQEETAAGRWIVPNTPNGASVNFDQVTWMVGGALLAGIFLGFAIYRGLVRWGSQFRPNQEPCSVCQTVAYQFICGRCKKGVGMCHSYHILLPDKPDAAKILPRTFRELCTVCVTDEERKVQNQ